MKKMIYALALLAGLFAGVQAQESTNDQVKVHLGFTTANADLGGSSIRGMNATGQIVAYRYEGVKLEAAGDFAVFFFNGERLHTYMGGPQIGVNLFEGRLNPFVNVKFGGADLTFTDGVTYGHSIGGGVDVKVSDHAFIRLAHDRLNFDNAPTAKRTTVGIGLQF